MASSIFPLVSVIIPHLNEPEDLRRCLAALSAQRSPDIPFEIIVVDNGSRVSPADVCGGFPGVRLENEPVPGPGPARNRGAAVATAEILAFIDADCVACPGWVRAIVQRLAPGSDIDFAGGDIRILPASPDRFTAIEAYESIFSYRAQTYVERYGFAATGNMAVRASVFRAVGPFGGISTMEDTEWGQRASARGYRIAYLPEARVLTPSCTSFGELRRRWDRHIAHEFRHVGRRPAALLKWLAASAVMAASPLGEVPKIMRSDRVSGWRERGLALACLTRVRLYRAWRMLGLAVRDDTAAMVGAWNR
ncbi:glycosyltransferase family A protein [Aquamicrobium sp. LC103]|uniref:glycosyltransferase n=1 Tax=Aquamicrobium sp. LC103 TaxID=1120658 RepID=UPI00063E77C6|nr:glycosyltransferase family A protein [Aquamicrobium sp. LC103]